MYWTKSKWIHLFCICLIIILGIKLIYPLNNYMDIILGDEAIYLDIANKFFKTIDLSFGPLYALYYKIYLLFSTDKLYVYYLNFKILSIVLPTLLYLFLVRLQFSWQTSLFIALSFLISPINITCWPKISHFTIVILLLFLVASSYLKDIVQKVILLTFGTFIIAYSRPEFFHLFYLLMLWCIFLVIKNRSKNNIITFSLCCIFFGFIFLTLGYPSKDVFMPDGTVIKRSYVAVVQHFYLSEAMRGIKHPFYFLSAYDYYYNKAFADCNGSVFKLFTQHFPLMFKHMMVNIAFYILQFITKLSNIINPLFLKIGKKFILSTIVILIALLSSLYKNENFKLWRNKFFKQNRIELIYVLLFLIPTLIACILMMPREHYIVLQILFIAIIGALLIEAFLQKFRYASYILLIAIVAISFSRQLSKYTFIQSNTNVNNVNVHLIKDLQQVAKEQDSILIFTDLLSISIFIDNAEEAKLIEYSYYYHHYKNFKDYILHKPYNVIIYSKEMEKEPVLQNDSTWTEFLDHPNTIHYKEFKQQNLDDTYRIFIKEH